MKRTPYAECEGKLYIKAIYAGMHIISLMIDGIPITFLGESKSPYLHIDEAIQWHEKEIKATNGKWKRKFLDTLLEAKRNFLPNTEVLAQAAQDSIRHDK